MWESLLHSCLLDTELHEHFLPVASCSTVLIVAGSAAIHLAPCSLTTPICFSIHLLSYSPQGLSQPESTEEMFLSQLGLFLPFLLLLCIFFSAEAIHQQVTKASSSQKLHNHARVMLCPRNQIMATLWGLSLLSSIKIPASSPIFGEQHD